MSNIAVITTFPNNCFEVYAKKMLESFTKHWPADIPLLVQLDDELLFDQVSKLLRPTDQAAVGWEKDHKEFVERNKGKDHPTDYRKQAVRFCHKVFAIKRAMNAILEAKANGEKTARYLIWMDADVITNKAVSLEDIKECLPKEGDAVAYLGRKDWDHSECGWLAFDLENDGDLVIANTVNTYISDTLFNLEQWHDSWVWDLVLKTRNCTNLTLDKPGNDIWPHSPMGKWSTHYKGPVAKTNLDKQSIAPQPKGGNVIIQTKNSIPDEQIRDHIRVNQLLIKNWIKPCKKNNEEIVIVSAGHSLIAEDLRAEEGKKIVAVKHALEPLKAAGVKPWACILLDPRNHVASFVENPDKDVIWFVASQVNPEATKRLLEAGCEVWGYHAAVGAGEENLTAKQDESIVIGGSATATRGMYMLAHLGFRNFTLYGYDLCYFDKPSDFTALDKFGQPKYLDISVGFTHPHYNMKRNFITEPQFIAQFEEIKTIALENSLKIKAYGAGMVPFFLKSRETGELRERERKAKLEGKKLSSYRQLFTCDKTKKTPLLTRLRKQSSLNRLSPMTISN